MKINNKQATEIIVKIEYIENYLKENFMIRAAKPEDKHAIAELSYIIWQDMELPIVQRFDKAQVISWLEQCIAEIPYRTYYKNVRVYEEEGTVMGCIVTYYGKDEMTLEQNWLKLDLPKEAKAIGTPLPLQEAEDDELYIETVAVFEAYRGKGIATQLMKAVIEDPKYRKISLSCDLVNTGAMLLYERLGFKREGKIDLYGHDYYHMVIQHV